MNEISILDRLSALEKRMARVDSLLGRSSPIPTKKASRGGQVEAIQSVLADGIPKTISLITKEVSIRMGKKQKHGSINAACSKLCSEGIIKRPCVGIYQKVA